MSNIRNWDAFRDRAWPWDFLNDCFTPTRVRVSDIDGVVERNGSFLFIEGKPAAGEIKTGQRLLLDALARQPHTTVIVLYGEPGIPEAMQVWPHDRKTADVDAVRGYVASWFNWASQQARRAA